jgi:hypothetical protein
VKHVINARQLHWHIDPGGILGVIGQGVRAIVGLKKVGDQAEMQKVGQYDIFLASRLLVSLFIGFIAGAAAAFFAINVSDQPSLAGTSLIGIAMAGYAGTDFIEGIASRFTNLPQPAVSASNSSAGGRTDGSPSTKETSFPRAVNAGEIANRSRIAEAGLARPNIIDLPTIGVASTIDQDIVDKCAAFGLRTAADIEAVFASQGGFFSWYNASLANSSAFKHRGKARNNTMIQQNFVQFWDQIPSTFDVAEISMIEFCALMSVNIQESSGNLTAAPEEMNGQGGLHPGLAYAFDRIAGLKSSYNEAPNKTALALFRDPLYLKQHGGLAGSAAILNGSDGIDKAWGGQSWPASYPSTRVDATVNGFVMEADFYKFRGRGVIQTTWRSDYKLLINYILNDPAAAKNPTLLAVAKQWRTLTPGLSGDAQIEASATTSTNADWDRAFAQPLLLAAGVAIDSNTKGKYLQLSRDATVLRADKSTRGSLLYMAAKINGGNYPTTVAPMMQTMMCGIANLGTPKVVAVSRQPRSVAS